MPDRESPWRVSWKWRIGILAVSLVFTVVLFAATTVFREILFVQPMSAAMLQAKTLTELGNLLEVVNQEASLGNVYVVFGLMVAFAMPLAAAILTRVVKSRGRLLAGMALSGVGFGLLLGCIYGIVHLAMLPPGVHSGLYMPVLGVSLVFISLLDGLLVGAITRKVGWPVFRT